MAALKYFTTPLPTPSSARGIRVGVIIVSHIPAPASGASRYSVIMKIRASFVFIILVTIWSSADSHKLQAVCQTSLLWVYCYQIFSIPILGQKRTAEDERLKLTGQKRTQTAQKTKISKLGDCAVGDGTRVCGGRWQVNSPECPLSPLSLREGHWDLRLRHRQGLWGRQDGAQEEDGHRWRFQTEKFW